MRILWVERMRKLVGRARKGKWFECHFWGTKYDCSCLGMRINLCVSSCLKIKRKRRRSEIVEARREKNRAKGPWRHPRSPRCPTATSRFGSQRRRSLIQFQTKDRQSRSARTKDGMLRVRVLCVIGCDTGVLTWPKRTRIQEGEAESRRGAKLGLNFFCLSLLGLLRSQVAFTL